MKSLLREKAQEELKKNSVHGKEEVRVVFNCARSLSLYLLYLSALLISMEADNSPQSSQFPLSLERNRGTDLTAQRR